MSRKRKQKIEKTPVKADITALSHDGRGIAKLDGKTTFIRGGLPGETVEFIYSRKSAKFDEGQVSEVLSPAANRVEPPCEFFGLCGACNFQHLNPSDQIQHKQTVLLEQLKHIAGTEPAEILPPLTAETEGYRRKARLGVRYVRKKERVLVGFREIAGRYLADMRSCKILHPSVGQELQALAELIQSLSLYEEIPQIEVAVGDDATALVFRHLKPLPEEDQTALIEFAKPKGLHIYLQSGGPETVKQIYPMPATNRLSYHLLDQSLTLQFHPNDFTQVNAAINQQMLTQALGLLDLKPNETALDLFCGLGNFSLALAKQCQHVTAIEGEKAMVERGYENAKLNGIDNITFQAANLANTEQTQAFAKQVFDKILLDPPRSGAFEILPLIAKMQAKKIVYVSCNPATLARDTQYLIEHGYTLTKAGVMDMFPHTSHVEAMALFDYTHS